VSAPAQKSELECTQKNRLEKQLPLKPMKRVSKLSLTTDYLLPQVQLLQPLCGGATVGVPQLEQPDAACPQLEQPPLP
jgi:hypothetical protein